MRYETFIAWRHLASTRGTFLSTLTTLAIVGVALGVTALTAVVSVAGGFVDTFRDRVVGVNAHIVVSKYGLFFSEYPRVQAAIEQVPGVRSTAPYVLHEMLVTSATSRSRPGVLVKGSDVDVMLADTDLAAMTIAGDLADLAWDPAELGEPTVDGEVPVVGIALGRIVAERLQVEVGDAVTLISPLQSLEAAGWRATEPGPTWARFRVVAIVSTGFYDYDHRLALADYRALQRIFRRGNVVSGIEVRVDDVMATERLVEEIEAVLTTGRYQVIDWPQINRNLFASLNLQKLALTIVMSCLVMVASSVILCVLIMLVLQKRREIAILRAMGMPAAGVMRIFILEGALIGAVGTTIGVLGGAAVASLLARIEYGLALEIYRIEHLPVSIQPLEFLLAALGAMAICLLATLYPSWRAARTDPVEALRYD
ncbi:MAG: ABC transporter permease [Deltaproteobacteria bacterium]|nr:MAG: ABC transporter permease [Deltaproteobacteria bacterium]